ncbi:MAG: hypothetical protein KatS3mg105_2719 [Gemmatales bacterium]|nr:MAG: hypothetical protein KatS3mg105_2719 [Gemmatales bacterium]
MDDWYIGAGLYDGSGQRGISTGSQLPNNLLLSSGPLFLISEAGLKWETPARGLPGRWAIGGWYHNGTFALFRGGTRTGTSGLYSVLEQQLFREHPNEENDEQGIGWYAQYGYADPEVSFVMHHLGTGIVWRGAIPSRDRDSMGIATSWVRFSKQPGAGFDFTSETVFEVFYKLSLTKWANVTFDLQHIAHPGGALEQRNATIGTIRFAIQF